MSQLGNANILEFKQVRVRQLHVRLTCEKDIFSHLVSVVQYPLKLTLPCVISGPSLKASQLIIPLSFDGIPDSRTHTSNPLAVTD